MKPADLPGALELSTLAGWNQTAGDWAMLLDLAPPTSFTIELDGHIAATCVLVCYDVRLAWLGMVLTRPEYRGRGFARSLAETALAAAGVLGIASVMLDATDQGIALYRKLGFREVQPIERWTRNRPASVLQTLPSAKASAGEIFRLDAHVYHAGRSELLSALIARGGVFQNAAAFVLSRPGRIAPFLGPCIAGSEAEASEMIGHCLNSRPAPWFWDLLPANESAAALARRLGFQSVRRLTRMVRGADISCQTEKLWATAGFELG